MSVYKLSACYAVRAVLYTVHLMGRITGSTHRLLDHRKHIKGEGRDCEGIYGDILVLMSAPPVGNFSLTFMFNFLSLSRSLIVSLSLFLFLLFLFPLFVHYPVRFPFALHESYTRAFAASAVAIVRCA